MTQFITFHLYGPMQAWGGVAVGEMRGSEGHPTKSGVLGLIGAALGLQRHRDEEHLHLEHAFGFAVRIDDPGRPMRDYHSIQTPSGNTPFATRRDELKQGKLNALITRRDYRADACYTIALWQRQLYPLEKILEALKTPHFLPYLGRKSCPLGSPLFPAIHNAPDLAHLLKNLNLPEPLTAFANNNPTVYWEGTDSGLTARSIQQRRDRIVSRQRRTFGERQECYGVLMEQE